MLEINKRFEDDALLVTLVGRLDTTTSPELEEVIRAKLPELKKLVFDFEKLDYISSAGLRVLLYCQKVMNKQGEMKVMHVNETIEEIFEVTGFDEILTIE
ncbi:MAG: STAS domain-containing protein [Lachnospiraceae bacterium]|nr:STAS domain-containing protein [Lachnospiraceae bacterium]